MFAALALFKLITVEQDSNVCLFDGVGYRKNHHKLLNLLSENRYNVPGKMGSFI